MKVYCYGHGAQELYVQDICDAMGFEYAGKLEKITDVDRRVAVFPLGSTPEAKERVVAEMQAARVEPCTLIHPTVQISASAVVGKGVILNPFVSIAAKAKIEDGVVVHAHSVIGHDNEIGVFSNLSPGCLLAGSVKIGARVTLGTGVVVCPNLRIGMGANVWAGAVIQKDAPPLKTYYVMPQKQPFRKGQ